MLEKNFKRKLGSLSDEGKELVKEIQNKAKDISEFYRQREYAKAMVLIRNYADRANKYFDDKKPWVMIKEAPLATQSILTDILNVFRLLAIFFSPSHAQLRQAGRGAIWR